MNHPAASQASRRKDRARTLKRRRTLLAEQLESRSLLAILLGIPGINGTAPQVGATDTDISLQGFDWNFAQPTGGQMSVGEMSFLKPIDSASPQLMKDAVLGPIYSSQPALLRVTDDSSGTGQNLLQFALTNSRLTSFHAETSGLEAGTLNFSQLDFTETLERSLADGQPLPGQRTASFNLLNGAVSGSPIDAQARTFTSETTLTIGGKELVINGFNWGVSNSIAADLSGGQGRAAPADLSISRPVDMATAGLLSGGASQTVFPTITLTERRLVGSSFQVYATWTLNNAKITSFHIAEAAGEAPANDLQFSYTAATLSFTPFDANNVAQTPKTAGWNFATNTSITSTTDLGVDDPAGTTGPGTMKFGDRLETAHGVLQYESLQWSDSVGKFGSLAVTMRLGQASPGLFFAVNAGGAIDQVLINGVVPSSISTSPFEGDFWDLHTVVVQSFTVASDPAGEPTVTFNLAFASAKSSQGVNQAGTFVTQTTDFNQTTDTTTTPLSFGNQVVDPANPPQFFVRIEQGGQTSEFPIQAAQWAVNRGIGAFKSDGGRDMGKPQLEAFQIVAPRGLQSPGLFLAAAQGVSLGKVSIIRQQQTGGVTTELYRWILEGVKVESYETRLKAEQSTSQEFDGFTLRVGTKLTLQTPGVKSDGTKTTSFSAFFVATSASSNGLLQYPTPLDNHLAASPSFLTTKSGKTQGSVSIDSYRFSGFLPVSANARGVRSVGTPDAQPIGFAISGIPSTGLLAETFAKNNFASGTRFTAGNILAADAGEGSAEATWNTTEGIYGGYTYSDAVGGAAQNQYSVDITSLDFTRKLFANGSQIAETKATWNDKNHATTLTGGFGGFQFPTDQTPANVLSIGSSQLELLSYEWAATNPINQAVGSAAHPVSLAPRSLASQQSFQVSVPQELATPGMLQALASGQMIPEIKITQRANLFVDGSLQYLPYREWTLSNVYITSVDGGASKDHLSGVLNFQLNAGKIESHFTEYVTTALGAAPATHNTAAMATAAIAAPTVAAASTNDFGAALDFTSPPVALGISGVVDASTSQRQIDLSAHFIDSQEPSTNLQYSFEILSNPGLFTSIGIFSNTQLVLDYVDGMTGVAQIRVTATNSFGLQATSTFDVAIDAQLDFGDAPAPYPTLLADNGAAHVATGPTLGQLRSSEFDGLPSPNADADDDDGVVFDPFNNGQATSTVTIDLENAATARIDAWIDFNQDGDWNDPGEQILTSVPVFTGQQSLTFNIPATNFSGDTFARVRVSTAGLLAPTGFAADGEVEDYRLTVASRPPVVANLGPDSTYVENANPVLLFPSATLTDDAEPMPNGHIRMIIGGGDGDDRPLVISNGPVTVSGFDISYNGTLIGSYDEGSAEVNVQFNELATTTMAQAVLRSLAFKNVSEHPNTTQRSVGLLVTDAAGSVSSPVLKNLNLVSVNDAPGLNSSTGFSFGLMNEDASAASIPGVQVSTLLNGQAFDLDNDPLGIAVVNLSNTGKGTYQFQLSGGAWTNMPAVSETAALLLPGNALVRFLPNPNANGSVTFYFRAWDGTAGTAGGTLNLSNQRGGAGSVSVGFATALALINPVNDAPVLNAAATPSFGTLAEDTAAANIGGTLVSRLLVGNASDVDGQALGIAVIGLGQPGKGTYQFQLSGGAWTNMGTVSETSALLLPSTARVRFVPNANFNGTVNFVFRAWDGTLGSAGAKQNLTGQYGGAGTVSSAFAKALCTITPVNDAPVLGGSSTPSFGTIAEDTPAANIAGTLVSNVLAGIALDADGDTLGIAVIGLGSPSKGTYQFQLSGGAWTNIGTVSETSALLLPATALVRFVPNANFNGSVNFLFRAWDGTVGTAGTQQSLAGQYGGFGTVSSAFAKAICTVTSVNDAPVLTPSSSNLLVYQRGKPAVVLMGASATVTDVDSTTFAGGQLKITGIGAQDVVDLSGRFSFNGTSVLYTPDGQAAIVLGTRNAGGGSGVDLTIDLQATATPDMVQRLIRTLTFKSTGAAGTRNLSVTLSDDQQAVSNVVARVVNVS